MITANTYADDVSKWRLGRLSASTVTHRRPGEPDVVRSTGFSYDMGGAATGLLTEERTQPGGAADQALTVSYTLDAYGNRVQSTTCAAPATSCSTAGFQFQPGNAQQIKRYSQVEFDAQGRFPVATVEPFWTDTGGEERTTSRVLDRNVRRCGQRGGWHAVQAPAAPRRALDPTKRCLRPPPVALAWPASTSPLPPWPSPQPVRSHFRATSSCSGCCRPWAGAATSA